MDEQEFEDYLHGRYEEAVDWYDSKAISNKRLHYIFQYTVIIVAAITPILAITELKWPTTFAAALVAIANFL